jgi:tetratricopeptide (TPR) repeat protein
MKLFLGAVMAMVWACAAIADTPVAGDWRAQKDIRKRVEAGLDVAEAQIDASRKIYREGDPYKAQEELEEAVDTALEAYQMIVDEGEDMRKRAGRYKKIEIQLRGLLRKLEDYENQADLVDRGPIQRAKQTATRMQDSLLKSMFQGGKLPPVEKVKP